MSENKHTPGPWSFSEEDSSYWIENGMSVSGALRLSSEEYHIESLVIAGPNGQPLARVDGPADESVVDNDQPDYLSWPVADDEALANANLIAAAPDLFDALLTALPYVEDALDDPVFRPGAVRRDEKKIRTALSKAGEA